VHVFKYLEIQAIKEDRRRGVLTEECNNRRPARKSASNALGGFSADARRKRHTADSGYGSEQPLDQQHGGVMAAVAGRRWSQELSNEVSDN